MAIRKNGKLNGELCDLEWFTAELWAVRAWLGKSWFAGAMEDRGGGWWQKETAKGGKEKDPANDFIHFNREQRQ